MPHSNSANRIFSFFAKSYRKRFSRRGFEYSQKQLMEGIKSVGIKDRSLLEIGCGVGHFHQTLLEQGASTAVGVDLAESMIKEAKDWANVRGLGERVSYFVGDFNCHTDEITESDISILDKVVCCDPYPEQLLPATLSKTKQVIALTYPRDTWYVKMGIGFGALLMKLIRSGFRAYAHDPKMIEQMITDQGYEKSYEARSFIWLSQVYVRHPV